MVDSNCELAVRLGLRPYSEFEEILAPLFKRLDPEKRKEIVESLYILAAEKKVWESDKRDLERQEGMFREQRKSVKVTRGHIAKARAELLEAETSLHPDLPKWFDVNPLVEKMDEADRTLADNEGMLGRLADALRDPKGRTISHFGSWVSVQLDPEFSAGNGYVFPGNKATAMDYPFISALNECLPEAPPGRRSRFSRDEVIQKVFEILGESCSKSRITQARKRRRALGAGNKSKKT
jgi:hypothetical protein